MNSLGDEGEQPQRSLQAGEDLAPPIAFADIVALCHRYARAEGDRPSQREFGITLTSMFERDDTKIIDGLSPEELAAIVGLVADGGVGRLRSDSSPAWLPKILALVFSAAIQPIASTASINGSIEGLERILAHRALPSRAD